MHDMEIRYSDANNNETLLPSHGMTLTKERNSMNLPSTAYATIFNVPKSLKLRMKTAIPLLLLNIESFREIVMRCIKILFVIRNIFIIKIFLIYVMRFMSDLVTSEAFQGFRRSTATFYAL